MSSAATASAPNPPSTSEVQSSTQKGMLALQVVTACCHGVRNTLLTPLDPQPAWYPTLSANLATAKQHAGNWIDTLAPDMTSTIPTAIINYGSLFDAARDQIVQLLAQASAPHADQQDLVNQAISVVQVMQQQLQANFQSIQSVKDQLTTFGQQLQADHDALFRSTDSIQKALAADSTLIDRMNNDITSLRAAIRFANQQLMASEIAVGVGIFVLVSGIALTVASAGAGAVVLGAGIASVAGGAAGWGYWQHQINEDYSDITHDQSQIDAASQQIIALTGLSHSVGSVLDFITDASDALSHVATMWSGFDKVYAGVLADLGKEKATVKDIKADKLWIGAAHNEWDDLVDLANQMLTAPVTTEQQTLTPQ